MNDKEIFVVFDPVREAQPALDRAVAAAFDVGAKLRLYVCIYKDVSQVKGDAEQTRQLVAEQKSALESIAQPLREKGLVIETEVEWDDSWYKAVVRASMRHGSDLVFKSTYKHSVGQRVLKKTSDWTLIRECLCPVLLVREGTSLDTKRMLAAIDVRAEKETHKTLNKNIIDFCTQVIGQQDAQLHFINAYNDSMAFPDRAELIKVCGVESANIHIEMGTPETVIVDRAKTLDASVVVIGSSKRSGISALIHGNTVEKVLDDLSCDLLSIP